MSNYNLQETLQAFSSVFNHVIAKAVCEDLSRQRGDGHASALSLQYIAEVLKIRVTAPYGAMFEFKGRNVGPAHYFIIGVHVTRCAMRHRVFDLVKVEFLVSLAAN